MSAAKPLVTFLALGAAVAAGLLLLKSPIALAATVVSVAFFFFTFVNFELSVAIALFLIPFDIQMQITPSTFFVLDLLPLALIPAFLSRYWRQIDRRLFWLLMLFPLFAVATGWYRAENEPWFYKLLLRHATCVAFAFMLATICRTANDLRRVLKPIFLASVIVGLNAIWQQIIDGYGFLWETLNSRREFDTHWVWFGRSTSTFEHPNHLGGYACVVLGLLFGTSFVRDLKMTRWLAWTSGIAMISALLLSGSRGAIIGLIVAVGFGTLVRLKSAKTAVVTLSVAVIGAYFIFHQFPELQQRVTTLDEDTVVTRMDLYQSAWEMFRNHPAIGVGYTNFAQLMRWSILALTDKVHPHNIFLWVLSETGAIGFLIFFGPIAWIMARCVRETVLEGDPYSLGFATAIVAFLVHGMFDATISGIPILELNYTVFGLAIAAFAIGSRVKSTQRVVTKANIPAPAPQLVGAGSAVSVSSGVR